MNERKIDSKNINLGVVFYSSILAISAGYFVNTDILLAQTNPNSDSQIIPGTKQNVLKKENKKEKLPIKVSQAIASLLRSDKSIVLKVNQTTWEINLSNKSTNLILDPESLKVVWNFIYKNIENLNKYDFGTFIEIDSRNPLEPFNGLQLKPEQKPIDIKNFPDLRNIQKFELNKVVTIIETDKYNNLQQLGTGVFIYDFFIKTADMLRLILKACSLVVLD